MMDEEIRQVISEVREMKQMCGNINMKLTNIVTQRGQDWKKKLEAEYQRGFEDGKEYGLDESDMREAVSYQRGLNDAWEAARKIIHMPEGELLNIFTECYSAVCTVLQVILKYDASEVIEKLKAYEEKQKADDEIKVGDEVIYNDTMKCLVVRPESNDKYATLIDSNGSHHHACHSECKKTGRHFDIASILEAMKHD